jgi:nucleotide-binding universal stress UspA family protein
MEASFNKILLPVDFSINTEVAIKKAMEISQGQPVTIYLLHVIRVPKIFFPEKVESIAADRMQKLSEWKQAIEEASAGTKVYCLLENAMLVQECIVMKIRKLQVNLVIIGKQSHHAVVPWFNTVFPAAISKRTSTAVLTVKPGSLHHSTRIVVLPISDFIPRKKLEIVAALCKIFKVKIHLVTVLSDSANSRFSSAVLQETLRLLTRNYHCAVEFRVLHGNNRAKAIFRYADETGADMMLANPGTETTVSPFPALSVIDLLAPASKMQVLTVEPYSAHRQNFRLHGTRLVKNLS